MTFPPPGEISPTLASCFIVFLLVHRSLLGTYQKPTGLFPYILCSGQLLSLILGKTASPFTNHCALAPPIWLEPTAKYTHMELAFFWGGLMTTCLLTYLVITLGDTMSNVSIGLRTLLTGVGTNMDITFGLEVTPLMMAHSRNSMKTVISHVWIYLGFPITLLRTSTSLTTSTTSTKYLTDSASPEISPKSSSLVTPQLILVSHGIYPLP